MSFDGRREAPASELDEEQQHEEKKSFFENITDRIRNNSGSAPSTFGSHKNANEEQIREENPPTGTTKKLIEDAPTERINGALLGMGNRSGEHASSDIPTRGDRL